MAEVLADVASDQLRIADRIGELIVDHGGTVPSGQFPDRFSTLHDLAFDFLLAELIRYQDRTVAAIEKFVPLLSRSSMAQTLAQEALGMAKAHRDLLAICSATWPRNRREAGSAMSMELFDTHAHLDDEQLHGELARRGPTGAGIRRVPRS